MLLPARPILPLEASIGFPDQNCKLHQSRGIYYSFIQKTLLPDIYVDHEFLLFYTTVGLLSKGNVNCFFELKNKIKLFLQGQKVQVVELL